MNNWLVWTNTPWGKATGAQWRYALRNALALTLALYLAFALGMGQPYWAMTSAAVVSFPTFGAVISKSLGRIVGTFLGAAMALIIVGQTLNEPWLFAFTMAAWMGLCTYIAYHYQNNVAYAFQLAGYSAAIIAYSTVNMVDVSLIFSVAQARVGEVILGITCSAVMMMLLPSTSDGMTLLSSLQKVQHSLLAHFERLLQPSAWHPEFANHALREPIRQSHQQIIGQIWSMNLLRIQAYWTHHQLRQQDDKLHHLLHLQMRLTSQMSSLRRMLVNWPTPPQDLPAQLEQLFEVLQQPNACHYEVSRILAQFPPKESDDYQHYAFWHRLHQFCWGYLRAKKILWNFERNEYTTVTKVNVVPSKSKIKTYTDSYEAFYCGLRTFLVLLLGSAFWIETQWDQGGVALTLAAVSCILNAALPAPMLSIKVMLKAVLLLFIGTFFFKFGVMVQISHFELFAILLFIILITVHLIRVQSAAHAMLCAYLVVFMGTFLSVTNPPNYDFAQYLNSSLAMFIGLLVSGGAFQLLKPSSDRRKALRIAESLRRDFILQLGHKPRINSAQFESSVYHRLNQMSQNQDPDSKAELLRFGAVILNCHHIIWQLREREQSALDEYEINKQIFSKLSEICNNIKIKQAGLLPKTWQENYAYPSEMIEVLLSHLLMLCEQLSTSSNSETRQYVALLWRLHCCLRQAEQDIFDLNKEKKIEVTEFVEL